MKDCPINAFQECDCGLQCRSMAVDLGRFTRPEPVRSSNSLIFSAIAFVAVFLLTAWAMVEADQSFKLQDLRMQEARKP